MVAICGERYWPTHPERDVPVGLDEYMIDRERGLPALLVNPLRTPPRH